MPHFPAISFGRYEVTDRIQKIYSSVLWVLTIAVLAVIAVQGLSGNWVTVFFVLPGGTELSPDFLIAMGRLAQYHIIMGFITVAFAVLILIFAFLHKSHLFVRLAAIAGPLLTGSAILGGYLYVQSGLQDNWPLGQMMDSFIGAFAAYALMVVFVVWKRPSK
jgi:hypothetical protein